MTSKIQNPKSKITILTQYYPPEHGAPQNRLHDFARRWATEGHEITVLTAMPNYPGNEIFSDYRGRFMLQEEIDRVKVLRSWIFTSKKRSLFRQLLTYFSFVFSSLITGIFKLKHTDFLICESPPLFLGFSALVLKFHTKAKLIMNISDLWPESAVQMGIIGPGLPLDILEWFERLLYQKSQLVVCQTEGIVNGVKKRCPEANTFLFPNGVDLEMFIPMKKDDALAKEFNFPEGSLIVGYGGNHGRAQALYQIVEAAKLLKEEKVFFVLFGDGPEKSELQARANALGLTNLHFYHSIPREKMAKIQSQWDIAIVPLRNLAVFEGARPSKMFELMAGGIPFIFCGRGEGAEIAKKSGCAKVVPPENPEKLAEAIMDFAKMNSEARKDMGSKGRKFVVTSYDRAKLAEDFMRELEKILQ